VKKKSSTKKKPETKSGEQKLYTLEVFLTSGNYTEAHVKKNPVVSRTIQIRGDQTLEQLHQAIFKAFDRWEEHMYEFQFGKGPMDPKGERYVLEGALELGQEQPNPPVGRVDQTTIGSLELDEDHPFGYWFDFGDDWWHQINVVAIEDMIPKGKFPKVIKREGESPPQYPDSDEE